MMLAALSEFWIGYLRGLATVIGGVGILGLIVSLYVWMRMRR